MENLVINEGVATKSEQNKSHRSRKYRKGGNLQKIRQFLCMSECVFLVSFIVWLFSIH